MNYTLAKDLCVFFDGSYKIFESKQEGWTRVEALSLDESMKPETYQFLADV